MTVEIRRMAGFATIQDLGRPGYRALGVPVCGAIDLHSFENANALVGNPRDAAAIEWALAGGSLRFTAPGRIAVTGAEVRITLNDDPVSIDTAIDIRAGDEVSVERFVTGAYIYVAVRGGIAVPLVLGSRSTYLPAGFGGLDGRRLRGGDKLAVGDCPARGETNAPRRGGLRSIRDRNAPIRVVEGPNSAAFSPDFREEFWGTEFRISPVSNRTGYRLERPAVADFDGRSLVSEPACVGAIQVTSGASAIVLMADGPTVGGYPKIGVVASADIPLLAQRTPGDSVRFARVAVDEARALRRVPSGGRAQ